MSFRHSFSAATAAAAVIMCGLAASADAALITFEVSSTDAFSYEDGAFGPPPEDYTPETFIISYAFDPDSFVSSTFLSPGFSTFVSRADAAASDPALLRDFGGDETTILTRHNQFEGDETTLNQKVLEFKSDVFTYVPAGAPDAYDVFSATLSLRWGTSVFDVGVPLASSPESLIAELIGGSFFYNEQVLSGTGFDIGGTGIPDDLSALTGFARQGRARVIAVEGIDLPSEPADVPEPAALGLLGLGAFALAMRRRRS